MSDDPRVTVPAELVERLRRRLVLWGPDYTHPLADAARALVDAAERPACSHRWRAFPPDGKRYGYWRCDECGEQNEGPMCLVTTKERGVYRDPDPVSVVVPLADHPPVPVSDEAEAACAKCGFTRLEHTTDPYRCTGFTRTDPENAWRDWDNGDHGWENCRESFIAGFRAARQAGKDEQP